MSWIYEYNFQCLMELLPELGSPLRHSLLRRKIGSGLTVEVVEHHKYTSIIRLSQTLPLPWPQAASPVMMVRVYHDARVAEVLSYQSHRRFQPRYEYPNPEMHQRREKQRVNEFLGEWLRFSLVNGQRLQPDVI